jgi:hypothetical protein
MKAVLACWFLGLLLLPGCGRHDTSIKECPDMPRYGWDTLLTKLPFNELDHRQETVYNPLTRTNKVLFGDANYDYATLLTLTYAHRDSFIEDAARDYKCLMTISLLTRYPFKERQLKAIDSFMQHLIARGLSIGTLERVNALALTQQEGPDVVAKIENAELLAGTVEHGGRGTFFMIELKSRAVHSDTTDK